MSIESELSILENNKAAIKAAIISMNPAILPGDDMSNWIESIQSIPPPISFWGLTFTSNEPNVVVNMSKYGSPLAATLEYSTDAKTWTSFDVDGGTTPITLANTGDKVYFRAGSLGNTAFSSSDSAYRMFTFRGSIAASGNIMSLLVNDESQWQSISLANTCFHSLFRNCSTLTSAPELPATSITGWGCYKNMFINCSSLTEAPALPALSITVACYEAMFYGCSSLTVAPALPATTLGTWCYNVMFGECGSLTVPPPSLPATTIAEGAYYRMFENCYSLTSAPDIAGLAMSGGGWNCEYMFRGCRALVSPPRILPATTLKLACYESMFAGCSALTSVPELPATSLVSNCYLYMFGGCSSLTAGPKLPAKTLVSGCYQRMFQGCTSLASVEVEFTSWSPSGATTNWLQNVSSEGTFKCPSNLDTTTRDASHIPQNWNVSHPDWGLNFTANEPNVVVNMTKTGSPDAVSLEYSTDLSSWHTFDADNGTTPITLTNTGDKVYFRAGSSGNTKISKSYSAYRRFTLNGSAGASGNIMSLLTQNESDWQSVQMTDYCYRSMFYGCTSLSSAPELPATTLASNCYSYMFYGCSSLTSTPELPATTLATQCYYYMFAGCTSLTSAPELPATTLVDYCYYQMFSGCTSLTSAPVLPATRLVNSCYYYMFYGCSSLSSVEVAFTNWNTSGSSTTAWFYNVASSGTFSCPAALDTTTRDASHVPSGWTVVNV